MRRFVLISAVIAFVSGAVGSALGAEMTLTGELVDHACFVNHGPENGSGSSHVACAKHCAMTGMTVALVTAAGDVYVVAGRVTADNNASLLPHMSHMVEVTGEVSEASDVKTITTTAIKHISAN